MSAHRSLFPAAILVAAWVAGCAPTVGSPATCDEAAARTVVHRRLGQPAYLGQALILQSCTGLGGGSCHSDRATLANRFGVPDGLFFNVYPVSESSDPALEHLAWLQAIVVERRELIWGSIVDGSMPPGAVGALAEVPQYFVFDGPDDPAPEPIPPIASAEGREAVRNWLACGAPLVERSTVPPFVPRCTSDADCEITGRCDVATNRCASVGYVEPALDVPLRDTWDFVYDAILQPNCGGGVGCHGDPSTRPAANLDLSSRERAYAVLLGADGTGGSAEDRGVARAECGSDRRYVVPGFPFESLLFQKVYATSGCGSAMPVGFSLGPGEIGAIRRWIHAGAAP